ncbi:MAG: dolichyl-phosphate beta-glucosyltransferase [Candidatus Omnitrophota bacterium]
MKKIELSIVIPCFNEEKRLEPGLTNSINYIVSNIGQSLELVFVNDGSTDQTFRVLDEAKKRNAAVPIEVLSYAQNEGKGYAVKTGVLNSRGEKIIVMDADFSIDLSEMPKLIERLDAYDVVVGTKKHLLTQSVKKQKMSRRILGKGFTVLTNFMLGLKCSDITCGFKGFRREAAKDLFSRQRMKGWAYDAETLFLAKNLKYSLGELPVKWLHIEGSKVSAIADTVRSFKDLMAIIINYHSGRYN